MKFELNLKNKTIVPVQDVNLLLLTSVIIKLDLKDSDKYHLVSKPYSHPDYSRGIKPWKLNKNTEDSYLILFQNGELNFMHLETVGQNTP